MALTNLFREVAIKLSDKQPQMVDAVTEDAPILADMPMQPSTHGLHNVYEEVDSITGADIQDADAAPTAVSANTKLGQVDLSILSGKSEIGEDKANAYGGHIEYFADQQDKIIRKSGQNAEQSILYSNIRQYAIDNSNYLDAGSSANTDYSILCVSWRSGEISGLYNPDGFGEGALMDITPISNGAVYTNSDDILVYGIRYKSHIGIQLANTRYVSAILNANGSNIPTAVQMDDVVADARGQVGSTVLYMHPKMKSKLYTLKSDAMQMGVMDNNLNRVVDTWNGIPIITSYNFLDGTESSV